MPTIQPIKNKLKGIELRVTDCGLRIEPPNPKSEIRNPKSPCDLFFPHIVTRRGQALMEFTIVGAIALLALTFLIQIGLRANFQQEIDQQSFRRAMQISQSGIEDDDTESQAIVFHNIRHRQTPDPSAGLGFMPRVPSQGGGVVTWGEWLTFLADDEDSQPRIVVQLNKTRAEFRSGGFPDNQPFATRIANTTDRSGTIDQTGSGGGIATSLSQDQTDTTQMTLSNGETISSALFSSIDFSGPEWQ
ncbi:MAG: hypothetical protein L0Y56_20050 [Nitrospira sp.]|nr:hypothetical protein [Nitrospira sp.]